MADFDFNAARQAGYTDEEILSEVADKYNFDVQKARQSGYTATEIINELQRTDRYASGSAPVVTSSAPQPLNQGQQESQVRPMLGSPAASLATGVFVDYPVGILQQALSPPYRSSLADGPDLGISGPDMSLGGVGDRLAETLTNAHSRFGQRIDEGREAWGRGEGTDWWRVGGNVLSAYRGTQGTPRVPLNLRGRINQSAVQSGVASGLLPTDDENQRAVNFALGTAMGPVGEGIFTGIGKIPGIASWVKNQAQRFTGSTPDKTLQAMQTLLNNDELAMLNRYLNEGMTMRQAAGRLGNTGFAELVRASEVALPQGVVNANRAATQQVDDIYRAMMGADPEQRTGSRTIETLQRTRSQRSNELYEAARQARNANNDPITFNDEELLGALMKEASSGAYVKQVRKQPRIKTLAKSRGISTTDTEYWDEVVKALKQELRGADGGEYRAILDEIRALENAISEQNPLYEEAVSSYAALSVPLNRAQLAEDMWASTRRPSIGDPRPPVTGNVLKNLETTQSADELAQKSTNFDRSNFNNTIVGGMRPGSNVEMAAAREGVERMPENLRRVEDLQGALSAQSNYEALARMGGKALDDAFSDLGPDAFPGLLERSVVLYNSLRQRLAKGTIQNVSEHIGELSSTPQGRQEFARMYAVASPEEQQALSILAAMTSGYTPSAFRQAMGRNAILGTAVTAGNYNE